GSVAWALVTVVGGWATPSTVKIAVPVGLPAPGATGVMVARMMTGWPTTGLGGEADSTGVVLALLTNWFTVGAVAGSVLASPLKVALRVCGPTDSGPPRAACGSKTAWPLASTFTGA